MSKGGSKSGKVYLVGAGPGDLGLVTLRAKECIEYADVIPRLEGLASRFGDDDLVLFEARAA